MTAVQPKRLLWMRHISVWDDVPHYSTFNNLDVVELAASKHNEAAILQYTSSHLDNMSTVNRIYHRQHFCPSTVFHHNVGDRVRADACKNVTVKQVTDTEEE